MAKIRQAHAKCKIKNAKKVAIAHGKKRHFENGENSPRCMGYSPWKMAGLGQKLKMPKRCEKRLYDLIRVGVCKTPLQKTLNIRKIRAF